MAIDSQRFFNAAKDRANELKTMFGLRSVAPPEEGLSDVVQRANNFLQFFVTGDSSPEEARIAEANIGYSDAISSSVIPVSTAPNIDLRRDAEEKKEKDHTFEMMMQMLQEQIRESNERISKMIDECHKMAEWCREQAKKAAEAMDKIAERMTKNSKFINEANELIESASTNGQFDKEKARRLLLERGVKTDEKISDAKLMDLLKTQRDEANKDIFRDTKSYEEWEKQKQKYEESAEEIERLARELKQRRDEINELEDPEERAQRLKELQDQYSVKVQVVAAKLEENAEETKKLRAENQIKFDNSSEVKPKTEGKEISDFMADFGASASPSKKAAKLEESSIDDVPGSSKHALKNPLSSV